MKAKKSFKKFVQRVIKVIAVVLRVLFPQLCCKCLTFKNRKYAVDFLPGKDKELKAIEKFGWATKPEELRARCWSPETRLHLINQDNFTLINDITTEEELLAVVEKGADTHIAQAMRVYSPLSSTLANLLERFYTTEKGRETAMYLAENAPKVFSSLTGKRVLGSEGMRDTRAFSWEVAKVLARKNPSLARSFMDLIVEVNKADKALFDIFFKMVRPNEDDIVSVMTMNAHDFSEQYVCIRDNWTWSKKYDEYLRSFFCKFKEYLQPKEFYTSFKKFGQYGKMGSDIENAYELLKICYNRVTSSEVFSMMVDNLEFLKKRIDPSLYRELVERMLKEAKDAYSINSLIVHVPAECKEHLFCRLVRLESDRVLSYFPFPAEVCTEELAKQVVQQFAKKLPLERLGELSADLQKLVVDALELQSQFDAVKKHKISCKLLTEAEVAMIDNCSYNYEDIFWYATKFGLSSKAFKALFTDRVCRGEGALKAILENFVKVHSLSEEQYLILMQSGYAYLAPAFKNMVETAK